MVSKHPEILSLAGRLEVRFLHVDDNIQVLAEPKELIVVLKQERNQLCDHQPVIQIKQESNHSLVRPLQKQSKHSGEDLGNCRKAKA